MKISLCLLLLILCSGIARAEEHMILSEDKSHELILNEKQFDELNKDVIKTLIPLIITAESSGNPYASDGKSFGLMGISQCVLDDYNNAPKKETEIIQVCRRVKTQVWHWYPWGKVCPRKTDGYWKEEWELSTWPFIRQIDLFDGDVNRFIGTWYLRHIQQQLPKEYQESKPHIIFAWNSGIGKLKKLNYKIPAWTKKHPNRIYRRIYKGEL